MTVLYIGDSFCVRISQLQYVLNLLKYCLPVAQCVLSYVMCVGYSVYVYVCVVKQIK